MAAYAEQIRAIAPSYDPRHIEALMRVEHGTLDQLSRTRFEDEVLFCCACVDEAGPEMAESIAKSYGY